MQQKLERKDDEWKQLIERRLDTLETRQDLQQDKLNELEQTSLTLFEDNERIKMDFRELSHEVKKNWWVLKSPMGVLITVLITMLVYIIYNIL
jgi:uncharacterized coiled-coil protein SlyX